MLLIMGCRYNGLGSTDTARYYLGMEYAISSDSWSEYYHPDRSESGFQMFVFLLSRVFTHPQWLLAITSLIFIVSIFYFIDRNSNEIAVSTSLYITLGMMIFQLQGMRQALAMSLCLFAYELARKKKLIWFLLVVFLAATFHQTAIVFVIVYLLANLRLSVRNVIFVAVISFVAVFFSIPLVDIANNLFDKSYDGAVESGGLVATAIYVLALIVCCIYYSTHKEDARSPLVYVMIVGAATYFMRYTGVQIAERISFYFAFSQIALIPVAVQFDPKAKSITRGIIVLLGVALLAYRLGDSGFLPYAFFWD